MPNYCVYLVIVYHPIYGRIYYAGKADGNKRVPGVNYYGSCRYPKWTEWIKQYCVHVRVIKYFSNEKEQVEYESGLIKKLWLKHGAFLYGTCVNGVRRYWLDAYGKGTCINGHASSESINTPVIKEGGKLLRFCETSQAKENKSKALKAYHNSDIGKLRDSKFYDRIKLRLDEPEVRKAVSNALKTSSKFLSYQAEKSKKGNSKEARFKAAVTLKKNARKCKLSDGFVGCSSEIEVHTGLPHGSVTTFMTFAYRLGSYRTKSGITFYRFDR